MIWMTRSFHPSAPTVSENRLPRAERSVFSVLRPCLYCAVVLHCRHGEYRSSRAWCTVLSCYIAEMVSTDHHVPDVLCCVVLHCRHGEYRSSCACTVLCRVALPSGSVSVIVCLMYCAVSCYIAVTVSTDHVHDTLCCVVLHCRHGEYRLCPWYTVLCRVTLPSRWVPITMCLMFCAVVLVCRHG